MDKVDNREISRYYDSLLNICNDYGWEKLTQQYVFFVVLALFIRKHISSTFLSEKEMYDNQESVESKTVHGSVAYDEYDDEMSYFDYLLEYIGIDREGTIIPKKDFDTEDEYVAKTILNYNIVDKGMIMLNGLNLNFDFVTKRVALVGTQAPEFELFMYKERFVLWIKF